MVLRLFFDIFAVVINKLVVINFKYDIKTTISIN